MRLNKTEKAYIKRLFELKPDCTGKELNNMLNFMNVHDMKGLDEHRRSRDDTILNECITYTAQTL